MAPTRSSPRCRGATTGPIGATQQLYSGQWENAQSATPFEVTEGVANPTITYVPATATAGYLVSIHGQNLGGVTQVRLGPAPTVIIQSFQHINNMRIQFMIPATITPRQYRVFLTTANGNIVQSPTFMNVETEVSMATAAQSSENA